MTSILSNDPDTEAVATAPDPEDESIKTSGGLITS